MNRAEELAHRLAQLRVRIEQACAAAGRGADEVSLLAVSKTWPTGDVLALHAAGQHAFGENKHQEGVAKAAQLAELQVPVPVQWHFLGRLQSNKAKAVAGWADVVQSVDRSGLLPGLSRGALERGAVLQVLVQVSLDGDTGRGGAAPQNLAALTAEVAATEGLQLAGVMALAPQGAEPRAAFARLRELAAAVAAQHPAARTVSAGMSSDLEAAVAQGATLVRVGTALFGGRASGLG